MTTTFAATTTSAITFESDQLGESHRTQQFAAGTKVYAEAYRSGGSYRCRIPGTLLEQDVPMGSLIPA